MSASWVLTSSCVDIAIIDSSCWSARDGNTGDGLSSCGGVVTDGGLDSKLKTSAGAPSMLISARLKQ